MSITVPPLKAIVTHLADVIEYPKTGLKRKILLEDANCQYALLSLAAGTEIAEHTSPRNATVNVIEGQGTLTLEGKEIVLESGVFVFMPAATPHALKAMTNLTFLLTFSE
ncbi:cupin domain-containing protein [Leptolyngbyaceae cyanobacterium UHCC 1019]